MMFDYAWLLFAFPALGALIILFAGAAAAAAGGRLDRVRGCAGAFGVAALLFVGLNSLPAEEQLVTITWWQWMTVANLHIPPRCSSTRSACSWRWW
jgi:ABC-type glycerol-3-phosphate transport system substrate-binding protein